MKKAITVLCIISFSLVLNAQSVKKTMTRLPDTGLKDGYTATFGEDNDYSINTPYYINNKNGTVTDTITGLMWQQNDGGEMTIENARVYCDTLTLAGYTNWRLPTAHEAFSILNQQYTNPAMDAGVFTNTKAEYWWTSTIQANDVTKIWVTNAGGGIGNHPKSETISAGGTKYFHVKAVRDRKTPLTIPNQFTDKGNGTIYDNLTGLSWQKNISNDTLNWEEALKYADTFAIGGFTDWRLPNIKELQSVNDESLVNPSVNTAYFPNIGKKYYWSSTTLPNQTNKAWYLDTHFGITTYQLKIRKLNVILVRSNTSSTSSIKNYLAPVIGQYIYPNPFNNHIYRSSALVSIQCELINCIGQSIYIGTEIESQDFSKLKPGIYLLKVNGQVHKVFKLLKE